MRETAHHTHAHCTYRHMRTLLFPCYYFYEKGERIIWQQRGTTVSNYSKQSVYRLIKERGKSRDHRYVSKWDVAAIIRACHWLPMLDDGSTVFFVDMI